MAQERFDKLQFVVDFLHSPSAGSNDKLKFVEPFRICQRYRKLLRSKAPREMESYAPM